jgi:hypothetical protein
VTADDVAQLRGAVEIGNGNEPVPENVPDNSTAPATSILAPQFGHSGVCPRRIEGGQDSKARIDFTNVCPTHLQLFELFFPKEYIKTVLLLETIKKIKGKEVKYGKFLRWLGLWIMMGTIQGYQ